MSECVAWTGFAPRVRNTLRFDLSAQLERVTLYTEYAPAPAARAGPAAVGIPMRVRRVAVDLHLEAGAITRILSNIRKS